MKSLGLKKSFLYALIGSIGLSAVLGIFAMLVGEFGDFEIKVLLTSLTISGTSLCGVCCGAALEARRPRILAIVGIGLAALSALLIISGLWTEANSDAYWKSTATISISAVACSHLSVLMLARLAPRFAWAPWFAHVAVWGVALRLISMLWADFDEGPSFRLLGVAAILDGAVTILIPILHRLSRVDIQQAGGSTATDLAQIEQEIGSLRARLSELEQRRQLMLAAR